MTVTASDIDVPLEALLDRTACLVPNVMVYTANDTWTKPANALFCDFVVVGGGGNGGSTTTAVTTGGTGGSTGEIIQRRVHAAFVPSSLTVTRGAALNPSSVTGTNFSIVAAAGSTASAATPEYGFDGGAGGVEASLGGTAASGTAGDNFAGAGGAGGAGGTGASADPGEGGGGGRGYGAGGGGAGGCTNGGTVLGGGGGGGAGGYGTAAIAGVGQTGANPTGSASGGSGAAGIVVITTWCGVDLR